MDRVTKKMKSDFRFHEIFANKRDQGMLNKVCLHFPQIYGIFDDFKLLQFFSRLLPYFFSFHMVNILFWFSSAGVWRENFTML